MNTLLTLPKLAEKDVFNSFLVRNATYDGEDEIPCITTSDLIPEKVITFSKARNKQEYDAWIHFFEHDSVIECFWRNPQKYLPMIKRYKGPKTCACLYPQSPSGQVGAGSVLM